MSDDVKELQAKLEAAEKKAAELADALKWERVAFEDRKVRLEAAEKRVKELEDIARHKLAWERDGEGPAVPVLQERYDALKARVRELEGQLAAAKAFADGYQEQRDTARRELEEARKGRDNALRNLKGAWADRMAEQSARWEQERRAEAAERDSATTRAALEALRERHNYVTEVTLDDVQQARDAARRWARRWKERAKWYLKLNQAWWEGEFECPGQSGRCGRNTNNGTCRDCMMGTHPIKVAEDALKVILTALGPEDNGREGSYWQARQFLDKRGIYHDDLNGHSVLIAVAKAVLEPAPTPKKEQSCSST